MAKYSSKDLELTVGGTSMKAYIQDDVTLVIEAITEGATAFGDTWENHIYTGLRRAEPITVGGYYDDTATTGPNAKFNVPGTTLAIVITWASGKTSTFSAIAKKYDRISKIGGMTRYIATLLPTGAITEV